jgi:hypothetical protein
MRVSLRSAICFLTGFLVALVLSGFLGNGSVGAPEVAVATSSAPAVAIAPQSSGNPAAAIAWRDLSHQELNFYQ